VVFYKHYEFRKLYNLYSKNPKRWDLSQDTGFRKPDSFHRLGFFY